MSRKCSVLQALAEAKGAQPVFEAWKIAKNRPREQKMQRFAGIGGGKGGSACFCDMEECEKSPA